ncbi:MAG: hypothetical protein PHU68_08405 [Paludibacter sp.]|nr:hypothetical protein [Paludibacter sp.]
MRELIHSAKKSLAGWLLILFLGYFAGITLFPHTHIVDGVRITHSHPFSQSPDSGKHTHTSAQFDLIAHLSILLVVAISSGISLLLIVGLNHYSGQSTADPAIDLSLPVLCLRGPPAC